MKITILTYGSRGDVQPFLALALGLQKAGHMVKLAAPHRFTDFVAERDVPFVSLAGDPEIISQRLNDAGRNPLGMMRGILDYAIQIGVEIVQQTEAACQDTNLIINTFLHVLGAHAVACKKGVPDICIQPFPMFALTGDYPNVALSDLHCRALNRFTYQFSSWVMYWVEKRDLDRYENVRVCPPRHWNGLFGTQRIAFGPHCWGRGAPAFCHPQATGPQTYL